MVTQLKSLKMLKGIIDCDQLGIVPDIPVELSQLKNQNNHLIKEKRQLKNLLIFAGVSTGIFITIKLIHYVKKSRKEERD